MNKNFYAVNMMGFVDKDMDELSKFNEDTVASASLVVVTKSGERIVLDSDELKIFFEESV